MTEERGVRNNRSLGLWVLAFAWLAPGRRRSAGGLARSDGSAKLHLQKCRDEKRHAAFEIAPRTNEMHGGKFRVLLAREIGLDLRTHLLTRHVQLKRPHQRNRWAGHDAVPMRRGAIVGGRQPRLLLDLAHHAAGDIEPVTADIVQIGRAGRKINAAGVGGVRRHLAEHEGAIRAAQRAHAEAVEDLAIRTTPIAPGEETGEIGLEITRGKMRAFERKRATEQDAAIPEVRLFALLFGKMRRDLVAARLHKRPGPGRYGKVQRLDAVNRRRRHAVISCSVPSSSWPARRTCW